MLALAAALGARSMAIASRLAKWLDNAPAPLVLAVAVGLLLVIGVADYVTGTARSMVVFYLLPVGMCAWFLSGRVAVVMSVLCVLTANVADFVEGFPPETWWDREWNSAIALAVFLIVTMLLRRLHAAITGLEVRVAERTTALTDQIAEREKLEHQLLAVSEREQRRIGQELHDSLCQHLTGTALAGQVLAAKLGTQPAAAEAARIVALVEEGIDLTRGIARGLVPLELESAGLMSALEEFAVATSARTGVNCQFICETPVPVRDADTAVQLYRIAQEATGNALKHGEASGVTIALESSAKGYSLSVTDDGKGFPASANEGARGMGLGIMAHRAQIVGGRLAIESRREGGTIVTCAWPTA